MEEVIKILEFILNSFLHILPYLLITIPLAVIINLSGASKYISKAFGNNPIIAILLATVVGAFSPFCSCGVIPVIFSLLTGEVPLAPVMSFWIASPSMDPEIFFLSVSMIGWKLAVWRLVSTFLISLLAGYVTHFLFIRGFLGNEILNGRLPGENKLSLKSLFRSLKRLNAKFVPGGLSINTMCCAGAGYVSTQSLKVNFNDQKKEGNCGCGNTTSPESTFLWKNISREVGKATLMVTKFMALAFLLTALIKFYLPAKVLAPVISGNWASQVVLSTLIGIPMYTSNLTALPLVNGMMEMGLNKGAALSFLIAGATTTLPAMVAVWGITKRRIFCLYLSYVLLGSLLVGMIYNLFNL